MKPDKLTIDGIPVIVPPTFRDGEWQQIDDLLGIEAWRQKMLSVWRQEKWSAALDRPRWLRALYRWWRNR